jgi:hypothetical protein
MIKYNHMIIADQEKGRLFRMSAVRTAVLLPDMVFVSAAELAEIIGTDLGTVNNWIRRGIINRTPIGRREVKSRLFSKDEVYKAALKKELVKLGLPPSSSSDAVNTLWKDWDGKQPPEKHNLYAVVFPSNRKLTVALCMQKRSGGPLYKYKPGAPGSKSLIELELPEQAFAVLPMSPVLDRTNSRLSELLLGTARGRFSRD